jgi:hypothetical protein
MWLYEITTEDPVVLERPVHGALSDAQRPDYWWPEYACHEGNTIVPYYSETNRHERENPPPEPPVQTAQVTSEIAGALAGKWTGSPGVHTVDYDIFLEFTRNPDGTVQGTLIGTNLKTFRGRVEPTIDKPLRGFTMKGRTMNFELPNTQPWTFAGELSADGTAITGRLSSAQGSVPVTFRKG